MDFISNCLEEHSSAFTVRLEDVGFSGDLARQFLSETASGIMYTIKNTSLEKIIAILLSDDPSQLLSSINIDMMAKNLDINSDQASSGLEAIAPVMSQVFTHKCNEIVVATASLAWEPADAVT